jgi:ankyrin repeat protein
MQVLLDHGAKADAQSADGQTPLHQASHPDIVRLLLERGVDVMPEIMTRQPRYIAHRSLTN